VATDLSRISVYLTPEFKIKVEKKAEELGISVSSLINLALRDYMRQDTVVDVMEMFKSLKKGDMASLGEMAKMLKAAD